MKVVFTPAARASLQAIGRHIAMDNPTLAVSFTAELRRNARDIGRRPFLYAVVFGETIRRRVVGNYLIFYECDGVTVTILDIRHGAREDIWHSSPPTSR